MMMYTQQNIYAIRAEGMDGSPTGSATGTILLNNGYAVHFRETTPHDTPLMDSRYNVTTLKTYDDAGILEPARIGDYDGSNFNGLTIFEIVGMLNNIERLAEDPTAQMIADIRAANKDNHLDCGREERGERKTPFPITQIGIYPVDRVTGNPYDPCELDWQAFEPA